MSGWFREIMKVTKKSEQGAAVFVVLMIMLIFTVLALSLLGRWSFDIRLAHNEMKKLQAYYIARSGADALGSYLVHQTAGWAYEDRQALLQSLLNAQSEVETLGAGSFILEVKRDSTDSHLVDIQSTGTVDGLQHQVSYVIEEIEYIDEEGNLTYYNLVGRGWSFVPLSP